MTDNEIIKALKCCKKAKINQDCVVLKCPCSTQYCCNIGLENLRNEALNLINRQKAEINNLKAEIAEHKAMLEAFDNELVSFNKAIKTAKSEAYKEFAEKLKEFMHNKFKDLDEYEFEYITERDIDNL